MSHAKKLVAILQTATDTAQEKSGAFIRYLESPEFERDLDDLGSRLKISSQQLHHEGSLKERIAHKTTALAKHAAMDAIIGAPSFAAAARFLPRVASRRLLPWVGIATAGASVFKVGYHCYQIFQAKKKA